MAVWIIADDFTGANDSIVRFAAAGARSLTLFDPLFPKERLDSCQAVAFSVNSRGVPREEAYRLTRAALQQLGPAAGDLLYKKIDSALRGNIGPELDAMLDGLGRGWTALVAPALPENGRITAGGYQLLNGVPVHETEMAADPVTPVRESHLPTLLAAASRHRVGYLPLAMIDGGPERAAAALNEQIAAGCRIVAADATRAEHLDMLARLCLASAAILPCGTAGLAGALARRLFPGPAPATPFEADLVGPVAALIGSKSRNARLQMERALADLPWLAEIEAERIALAAIGKRPPEAERIAAAAGQALASGKKGVLVRLDADPALDPGAVDASALAAGLGAVARKLAETGRFKAFYLSGGDIAAAAVAALDGWGLAVRAELAPGVCLGSLRGGPFAGLPLVTKAGSFGDAGTLARALRIFQ
ncbi:uncharacterized protein YgbK (DUF1537 family) [Hydrogenispora ethanolica]|jgi:uncharacterized protein YgbK (DUF1537 family)|uniref:Uncharacterized protein YgbK (DUF1537 family) n=1 Tax=Hydrogenispora ethanolica TaxID=1082276 RepID=A0A4R1RUH6_HYDET|nr:four-carbon acid sugar kinase family protein [Hydrogenispora ethanolica]TCL70034.1 uncharacterized protein YgbK (DUF1537 family) [Hydrogenispora ethanolica]